MVIVPKEIGMLRPAIIAEKIDPMDTFRLPLLRSIRLNASAPDENEADMVRELAKF